MARSTPTDEVRIPREGASALVTGGASGLGEGTVRALAADGYHVVIADRDAERASTLARELSGSASAVIADVTVPGDLDAAVEQAVARAPLRVLCACAGIDPMEELVGVDRSHSVEMFDRMIDVNVKGTFYALRAASASMAENSPDELGDRGVCVMTASGAAFAGQMGQVAYASSKGAVVSMTLPAARDLASLGIRVCTIAPGVFKTGMSAGMAPKAEGTLGQLVPHPPRLGRPDEYAQLVRAIIANQMLNGETIRLDGAMRIPPTFGVTMARIASGEVTRTTGLSEDEAYDQVGTLMLTSIRRRT